MSLKSIVVFDFDGVIVDGITEYWLSSREAFFQILNKRTRESLPLKTPKQFRKLRPWVKNGWEMVLIAAELSKPESMIFQNPICFAEKYKQNCHEALKLWGWTPTELQIALDKVREEEIKHRKKQWLESHSAFKGIVKRIHKLKDEDIDFGVLTTKSSSFTSELLIHLNLYPTFLFGHESGEKPGLLLEILKDFSIKGFIEDRRATLETVKKTPGLDSLPCYLATWGYLKPNDFCNLPQGINLLKPEIFMSPLANWS